MKKITNLLFNDFTNDNRVLKISRSLQNNGYDVTLVTTHFDKELPKEEIVEGFKVKRFNVGRVKILPLNLILFWIVVIKNFKKENIFHCNDLYAFPPAYIIKKFFNKEAKIVYDCHEHETEAKIYLDKPIIKFLAKISERLMIPSADKVITVSESIADDYVRLYQIEKPFLVLNTPLYITKKEYNLFREKLEIDEDKIIFLFQGAYIPGRGVDTMLEVFSRLKEKNKNLVLVLLVYGDKVDELKEKIKGHSNVYWHDKVPVTEYMKYVSSADWGIYLMENICLNHDLALPNKIFDYILGGLPVVVSNLKEMSRLVNDYGIGYTVDPDDIEGTVKLLQTIKKETKNKFADNLKVVSKKFNWQEQEKVLLKVYNSL